MISILFVEFVLVLVLVFLLLESRDLIFSSSVSLSDSMAELFAEESL